MLAHRLREVAERFYFRIGRRDFRGNVVHRLEARCEVGDLVLQLLGKLRDEQVAFRAIYFHRVTIACDVMAMQRTWHISELPEQHIGVVRGRTGDRPVDKPRGPFPIAKQETQQIDLMDAALEQRSSRIFVRLEPPIVRRPRGSARVHRRGGNADYTTEDALAQQAKHVLPQRRIAGTKTVSVRDVVRLAILDQRAARVGIVTERFLHEDGLARTSRNYRLFDVQIRGR